MKKHLISERFIMGTYDHPFRLERNPKFIQKMRLQTSLREALPKRAELIDFLKYFLWFPIFNLAACDSGLLGGNGENIGTGYPYKTSFYEVDSNFITSKLARLESAYQDSSLDSLRRFFLDWEKDIPAMDMEEFNLLTNTEKEVCAIYRAFYNPFDLNKMGGSEWGAGLYQNVEFVIIQSSISYRILDTIVIGELGSNTREPEIIEDTTLSGFRPDLSHLNTHYVYLDENHVSTLNLFLGGNYNPMGTGSIMRPATGAGETAKRAAFLNNLIVIFHEHWGQGYMLETAPVIWSIDMNRYLTKAVINFSIIYQGGYALLEKVNGKWNLLEARLTWIT